MKKIILALTFVSAAALLYILFLSIFQWPSLSNGNILIVWFAATIVGFISFFALGKPDSKAAAASRAVAFGSFLLSICMAVALIVISSIVHSMP
ncbi:hypothetical protein LRR81_08085 [Metabacillus sp. GX 13764]|uniref:hypothetical protein n=1 Tax=Metabacillus kandeliae TaxID=2900151 RepID=UPI001E338635|nr:hypothetical protein [Metabacillus kandeliae]MCD7034190.1 hypothetical protein [Metabacillus kandeliae]